MTKPPESPSETQATMPPRTITRRDLAETIHRRVGLSQNESASFVADFFSTLSDHLVKGESVLLSSFGLFSVKDRKARKGRDLKTGRAVPVKQHRIVTFRPSTRLKGKMVL